MFVMPGDRAGRRRVRPGTGLSQQGNSSGGGLSIASTAVVAGAYTNTSLTVGADGRLTAASSGAAVSISAWELPFTKPTIAGVTQVNTTGFTSTDDTNGLFVTRSGALAGSDNLCLSHLTVPAGNWDLKVRVQAHFSNSNFACCGAHLYESGTGKVITWSCQGVTGATGAQRMCINYFTSTTAFSSQPITTGMSERPSWWKINYDGTNFTFYYGFDGYSWTQFGAARSKTAFFTTAASHAGFFLDPNDANIISSVKCMSLTCA